MDRSNQQQSTADLLLELELLEQQPIGSTSPTGPSCPICFQGISSPSRLACTLPCLHNFCKSCLVTWATSRPQASCALCRSTLTGYRYDIHSDTNYKEAFFPPPPPPSPPLPPLPPGAAAFPRLHAFARTEELALLSVSLERVRQALLHINNRLTQHQERQQGQQRRQGQQQQRRQRRGWDQPPLQDQREIIDLVSSDTTSEDEHDDDAGEHRGRQAPGATSAQQPRPYYLRVQQRVLGMANRSLQREQANLLGGHQGNENEGLAGNPPVQALLVSGATNARPAGPPPLAGPAPPSRRRVSRWGEPEQVRPADEQQRRYVYMHNHWAVPTRAQAGAAASSSSSAGAGLRGSSLDPETVLEGRGLSMWLDRELRALLLEEDVGVVTAFVLGLIRSYGVPPPDASNTQRNNTHVPHSRVPPAAAAQARTTRASLETATSSSAAAAAAPMQAAAAAAAAGSMVGTHAANSLQVASLRQFLFDHAEHFWHELRCFAHARLTLQAYDQAVRYEPPLPREIRTGAGFGRSAMPSGIFTGQELARARISTARPDAGQAPQDGALVSIGLPAVPPVPLHTVSRGPGLSFTASEMAHAAPGVQRAEPQDTHTQAHAVVSAHTAQQSMQHRAASTRWDRVSRASIDREVTVARASIDREVTVARASIDRDATGVEVHVQQQESRQAHDSSNDGAGTGQGHSREAQADTRHSVHQRQRGEHDVGEGHRLDSGRFYSRRHTDDREDRSSRERVRRRRHTGSMEDSLNTEHAGSRRHSPSREHTRSRRYIDSREQDTNRGGIEEAFSSVGLHHSHGLQPQSHGSQHDSRERQVSRSAGDNYGRIHKRQRDDTGDVLYRARQRAVDDRPRLTSRADHVDVSGSAIGLDSNVTQHRRVRSRHEHGIHLGTKCVQDRVHGAHSAAARMGGSASAPALHDASDNDRWEMAE